MSDYEVNYSNSADGRTLGNYHLSISTSLAIEGLLGMHPDQVPRPAVKPIMRYKEMWVNLRTLYRNIWEALPKLIQESIKADEIAQIMLEEMDLIPDILRQEKGQDVKVQYYFHTMAKVDKGYPEASIRMDNTPKQKIETQVLKDCLKLLEQHAKDRYVVYDGKFPAAATDTLLMTHVAYDLLQMATPNHMFLLESHTGKIKPRALWYTKLYNGKNLAMIPFCKEMLQLFGDKVTFAPLDSGLRKAVMEVATKRNWSSATTRERQILGIDDIRQPEYVLKLKKLYGLLF